jgi:DNA anti-recombination protein RmuC
MSKHPTESKLESKIDQVQQDVAALAKAIRDGFARVDERFARVDERFDRMDRRFDDVEGQFAEQFADLRDIVNRIYAEHGSRLKDIEDTLARNRHA